MKKILITSVTNNYASYLYTFLASLKENLSVSNYKVIVLHDGLNQQLVHSLDKIVSKDLEVLLKDIRSISKYSTLEHLKEHPAYWRLLSPYITNSEKVLYVDIDTLILGDLSELFDIELEKNIVGACIDYIPKISIGISNWGEHDLDPNKPYFNSGVLLIDTKKFKKEKILSKVVNLVKCNQSHLLAKGKWPQNDQYGLNIALVDRWKQLPIIYNYGSGLNFLVPKILHYIGGGKPGSERCRKEFTELYNEYTEKVQKLLK